MTSGSEIAFASAEALADLYRKKALSPVEAVEILFARTGVAAHAQRVLHRSRRPAAARAWNSGVRTCRSARSTAPGHDWTRADARLPDLRAARNRSAWDWSEMAAVARLPGSRGVLGDHHPGTGQRPQPLTRHPRSRGTSTIPQAAAPAGRRLRCRYRAVACRQRRRRLDPHSGRLTGIFGIRRRPGAGVSPPRRSGCCRMSGR
jgi:hypothetical protein